MDTITTVDRTSASRALVAAATIAASAPSVHNTQPWRWRIDGDAADLYADSHRQLHIADPERRLLILSCGVVLNHFCVALAAAGIAVDVVRLSDPDDADRATGATADGGDADHLARITVSGRIPVTDAAIRLCNAMKIRHSDRRPLCDEPLPPNTITAMRAMATTFGVGLHLMDRSQIIELASATSRAQDDEIDDPAARAELDLWTDPRRPAGAGVPDATIPERKVETTVPMREFGRDGSLVIPDGHDNAAAYLLLYGLAEQPQSWLRAGEALSAVWLTATEHMVSVLPLSAAVESPATRQSLHRMLAWIGYPYLALRLGIADANLPAAANTPRLAAETNIEVLS
jgi:hypothetical protein